MTHLTPALAFAETHHTVLRRMTPDDCDVFQAYRADPEVARFQSWESMTDAEALRFLHHVGTIEPLLRAGQWAQIAIAVSPGGKIIGDMGIFIDDTAQEAEVGITLARAHQGKGHATNAMKLAIALIFDTTKVMRIICGADQRNSASLNMIARLPFRFTHIEAMPEGRDKMFELTHQMWQEHVFG